MGDEGAGLTLFGILLTALVSYLILRNLLELAVDLMALPPVRRRLLQRARTKSRTSVPPERSRLLPSWPAPHPVMVGGSNRNRLACAPVAILIPAWREAAVIGDMLEVLLRAIADEPCHVFVGWYPNDPATARAARRADPQAGRVTLVRLPHDGPTSKADCLNHLYRRACEDPRRFAFVVLHDAEDIVAPGEISLLRRALIDGAAMAQVPVLPDVGWRFSPIAHHYADEFADMHSRTLPVRALLTGSVPSAGVGTAITVEALRGLAVTRGGRPFDPDSLTEDYELSLALARTGAKGVFVSHAARASTNEKPARAWTRGWAPVICVRECFPAQLAAAVRQKARWMIGIALQTPRRHGLFGTPVQRIFLLHDRMMIANALIDALCAGLCLAVLIGILFKITPSAVHAGDGFAMPWLGWMAAINGLFLLHRLLVRIWLGARRYGWRFALGVPWRQFAGVAINAAAAVRALRIYRRHRRSRAPLVWDKTEHRLPLVAAE
ncbi:MAG: hypothetical protein D6757_03580 [Alphaproteobacteria bacterium]|nr:MAG: hypothetical protein D6757_03580 [Alphaproteobacteria bacterium]